MTSHRIALAISLLVLMLGGASAAIAAEAEPSQPVAQAQPAADPATPAAPDTTTTPEPAATPANPEPIGNVAALTGTVTLIRNKNSLPLKLRDDIYLNDTVATASGATLGITFDDGTTFRLSANSKITIDNYVYEDGGKQNAAIFNVARGTVGFVAAAVAKTGDMKIDTPTATLGIRGTTGLIEVPDAATSPRAGSTTGNVAIKLYPDADGRVGHIDVNDRTGTRLGALTQAASGFTIRPGAMAAGGAMRFAAVPLVIAARDVSRDRGFVREVHSAQTFGRQIVTEQRAFRRANPGAAPGLAPNRGAPSRQNLAPGPNNTNRPGQTPAQPGRTDQKQGLQQGRPAQNGLTPRGAPNQRQERPARDGRELTPGRRGSLQTPPQQLPNQPQRQQRLPSRDTLPLPQQATPTRVPAQPPSLAPSSPTMRPSGTQQAAPQLQRPAVAPRLPSQRQRPQQTTPRRDKELR